ASYRWTIREWWSTSDSNRAQPPCKGDPRTCACPGLIGHASGGQTRSACTELWRDGSDPPEWVGAWGRFRAHLSAASARRFHQISFPGGQNGAADGNRTHVCAWATHGSAIELRTLVHRAGLEPAKPGGT